VSEPQAETRSTASPSVETYMPPLTKPATACIIEFTGPPGGGKSTVSEHLRSAALRAGLRCPTPKELRKLYMSTGAIDSLLRWWSPYKLYSRRTHAYEKYQTPYLVGRFALNYRRGFALYRARLAELRRTNPEDAELIQYWVEQAVLFYQMARNRTLHFDYFFWEEGIAHRAMNLFASPEQHSARTSHQDTAATAHLRGVARIDLERFLSHWAFPDALVHVSCDTETCIKRMAARGFTERLQGCGESEIRAFVKASSEVARAIADAARRRGLPVYEIPNSFASLDDLLDSEAYLALETSRDLSL